MTTQEFNNDSNQAERRSVQRDCYLSRAQADADMIGGRFKQQTQTHVTGVPQYPRQPISSPWHSDPVPPEEPFGVDIEFVGELGGGSAATTTPPREGPDTPSSGPSSFLRRRV